MLLSIMLVLSLLAACSSNSNSSGNGNSGNTSSNAGSGGNTSKQEDAKIETVVFALPTFNRVPDDLTSIEEAVNAITVEKANVKIDLQLFGVFDYVQKVNLALQSGEQLDVFVTPGEFASFASKGQVYPLDELLERYGQETLAILDRDFGEDILKSTTFNGTIYGIPANRGNAAPLNFVYNADMFAELGFTKDDVNSIHDLP
jgi:putative aldouronate transport system substrate-binding protein